MFDRMIFEETYPNAITSTASVSAKVRMVLASDALAIRAAIRTTGVTDPAALRMATQTLYRSHSALWDFFRRKRARVGISQGKHRYRPQDGARISIDNLVTRH